MIAARPKAAIPVFCNRIAESTAFQMTIVVVILLNALTLGLLTFESIRDSSAGDVLAVLDVVFLGIFVCELAIRILAYGARPQDFFHSGWNVFDFIVIMAAFVPGVRENVTLLRLVRLGRVLRIVSVLPELRVLLSGVTKSLPPIGSLVALTALVLYIYGMVGWALYHEALPEQWGNIGEAMLTMFILLTLENWPAIMGAATSVHPASWIFFVSFILIASFIIINTLIGIVIGAMEQAREEEHQAELERLREEAEDHTGAVDLLPPDLHADTVLRLQNLRMAVDELELQLGIEPPSTDDGSANGGGAGSEPASRS